MELDATEIGALIGSVMWPMMRIGAMLLAMPVMGGNSIPVRIRVVYSVLISWMIAPILPGVPEVDLLSAQGFLIALHEIILGLAMGMCLQFIFVTLIAAGEQMAMSMGLGFASMIDPTNGVNVPVLSQMLVIVGTLLYFVSGVHNQVIEMMVQSFFNAPIQAIAFDPQSFMQLATSMTAVAANAVLISIPITGSVLLVYLGLGVMTRAAPQLNIFSIGFPVTLLTGIVSVLLLMPAMGLAFERLSAEFINLAKGFIG